MIILPDLMTIITVTASLGILAAVAFFLYRVLRTEREFQEKEQETFTKYKKILDKANDQARAMMYTSSIASSEILSESKQTNEHVTEDLDKILQHIAQKHIHAMNETTEQFQKAYTQSLAELQSKFQEQEQSTLTVTQDAVSKSLEEFGRTLSAKTVGMQELIDQKTTEQLEQTQQEIEQYKANRLRKVDVEISQLVQKTFEEVLRKSIPESLHEEIILEALEKAKKENVLVA